MLNGTGVVPLDIGILTAERSRASPGVTERSDGTHGPTTLTTPKLRFTMFKVTAASRHLKYNKVLRSDQVSGERKIIANEDVRDVRSQRGRWERGQKRLSRDFASTRWRRFWSSTSLVRIIVASPKTVAIPRRFQ
jgi:hypothetical protein